MSTSYTSSAYTYGDPRTIPILCECGFEAPLHTSWTPSNPRRRFRTCSGLRVCNHVVYFVVYMNRYIVTEYLTMQCFNHSNFFWHFRVIIVVSLSGMIQWCVRDRLISFRDSYIGLTPKNQPLWDWRAEKENTLSDMAFVGCLSLSCYLGSSIGKVAILRICVC